MTARRVAVLLVALLAILVALGVYGITRQQALIDEEIAAIRSAGDPAFLIDLERSIDPQTNAAFILSSINEEVDQLYAALSARSIT